jgi:murein DD-endopeptidase MepM/ murein hydrolase activator NlpD
MLVASLMLGGLLPMNARTRDHWGPSGAFRMPVGDPYQVYEDRPRTPGPFFIVRGVAWEGERASHQGADLGSGSAGALVRAAGSGVVVSAQDHGEWGGYGTHVVLAHRLPEGVLAYTVYAHLREYSPRVKAGECVQAGEVLGRVGETGHATGPHLHFEVRVARDPEERWEFARVEDPLAFVDARLPTYRADSTGIEANFEWAEYAGLVAPGARTEDALTHEAWWRMIAAGVRGPGFDPALAPLELHDSLVAARMLWTGAGHTSGSPSQEIDWSELAHDLGRARALGVRTGPAPLRRARHRETCTDVLGTPAPAAHVSALISREGHPTLGEAVMLFADLAGPAPEPAKPAAKKPVAPASPSGAIAATGTSKSGAIAGAGMKATVGDSLHRAAKTTPAKATTARRDTLAGKTRKPSASAAATAQRDTVAGKTRKASTALTTPSTTAIAQRDSSGAKSTKKPAASAMATQPPAPDSRRAHAPRDTSKHVARRDTSHAVPRAVARRDSTRTSPPAASPAAASADTSS